MSWLRSFVRFYFGLQALSLLLLLPLVFGIASKLESDPSLPPLPAKSFGITVLLVLLMLQACVVCGVPGWAWWALRKEKPSARRWALAASILSLFIGAGSEIMMWNREGHSWILRFDFIVGILGIVAFWHKSTVSDAAQPKFQRIAGDGTSALTENVAVAFGWMAYFAGMYFWRQWGSQQGLPDVGMMMELLQLQVAELIVVGGHEAGHVLGGWHGGMLLYGLHIGPFHAKLSGGKWTFFFRVKDWLGGSASMVSPNLEKLRERTAVMILGGPVASLVLGLAAWLATLVVARTSFRSLWIGCAMLSVISILAFVVNMIPQKPGSHYSDGARFYQLIRKGPWAQVNMAMGMVASSVATKLRPRDWDISIIQSAADFITSGEQAVTLRWFAAMHHLDNGDIPQATIQAQAAQAMFEAGNGVQLHGFLTEFVFFSAVYCQDQETAERWWSKVEAIPKVKKDEEFYLAQASILWLRGELLDAWDAWDTGFALAVKLPQAGAYDYTRQSYEVLRVALNLDRRTNTNAPVQQLELA